VNIDTLLDERNRMALSQLLKDMSGLTQILAAKKNLFDKGISDAAKTMENLVQTTHTLNEEMPLLIERIYGSAEALEIMAQKIGRTSISVGSVVENTKPDIERFSQLTLNEMSMLVAELRQLTASLQRSAQQLEREPNSLIFGRTSPPLGPGE